MRDVGKGDKPRPLGVSMEEFDKSWDAIFNTQEEKKSDVVIDIEVGSDERSITVTKTWDL